MITGNFEFQIQEKRHLPSFRVWCITTRDHVYRQTLKFSSSGAKQGDSSFMVKVSCIDTRIHNDWRSSLVLFLYNHSIRNTPRPSPSYQNTFGEHLNCFEWSSWYYCTSGGESNTVLSVVYWEEKPACVNSGSDCECKQHKSLTYETIQARRWVLLFYLALFFMCVCVCICVFIYVYTKF